MKFNTKILHGKAGRNTPDGGTLPGISQVSAFSYDSAEHLEKVFGNKAPGFAYTRIGNPTVAAFEQRINELEGGVGAVACASGMAAITAALLNVLSAGDEIIAGSGLFGGTIDLFKDLEAFGITTHFIPHITVEDIKTVLNPNIKVVFGELIGNPGLDVVNIKEVTDFLHENGVPFIADATTATPYLVNALSLGADVVIHSSSKYINGSGNLNILGLETLGIRMKVLCQNALTLAKALEELAGITVNYPGLESSPYKPLVDKQFGGLGGAILTIRAGSREKAFKLINSLKYAHIATNIGDLRTLVIHPSSTIYLHSTKEEQEHAGVYEDTIRISVGIEDVEDLIADFTQAIENI